MAARIELIEEDYRGWSVVGDNDAWVKVHNCPSALPHNERGRQ